MMVRLSGHNPVQEHPDHSGESNHRPMQHVKPREQGVGRLAGLRRLFTADLKIDDVILSESSGIAFEL